MNVSQYFNAKKIGTGIVLNYAIFPIIYSVSRKVNPNYLGSLIRIRRDSDGLEQDIGDIGGELNLTAISDFCIGTIGRIQKIYNQGTLGASYDVTYYTGTRSIIYQAGAIETVNGKPAMLGQANNGYRTELLLPIEDSLMIQPHIFSAVLQTQPTAVSQAVFGEVGNGTGNQRKGLILDTTTVRGLIDNINTTFGGSQTHTLLIQAVTSQQRQYSFLKYDTTVESNNSKSYWNGVQQTQRQSTVTWVGNTGFRYQLMRTAFAFLGRFQEVSLSLIPGLDNDDTLLRLLEAEQNAYYTVY